ncbi:MAG: TIGR03617 family F420-dependent LLM class oxidoreductase [Actinomycetota bacterium]
MAPLKLDVWLGAPLDNAATRARDLQNLGVDGIFTFENAHDLFFPLVAAAPVCSLDLMTNVAIAFPRSPLHLAHAAWDLGQLSQGRFSLGIGSQIRPHIEKRYGSTWSEPVERMREWVQATRAILDSWQHGTPLRYEGRFTRHTLMTPNFNPGPNPYGVPKVLVGALGPKMTQMAAAESDGILIMPFNSAAHLSTVTLPAVQRGLTSAHRDGSEVELIAEIIVGMGRTDEELERAKNIKTLMAFYGSTPSYKSVLDAEGAGDLQPRLNEMSKRGQWAEMTSLISDDLMGRIGVFGTPKQCAEQIVARVGSFASRVCAYFPAFTPDDDLLAEFIEAFDEVRSR